MIGPCVTVNVWPAIVIVPERTPLLFAGTVKPTTPLPLPGVPLVTVTTPGLLLTAVHAHPPGAVTPTVLAPPA
jgi:hypothetical protein